jgi:hypothetical protein
MKFRSGYVSNSSSTSFCLYGSRIDQELVFMKLQELKKLSDEQVEAIKEYDLELGDVIKEFEEFDVYYDADESEYYIGRSWASVKDDETGAAFKEDVKSKLIQAFGNDDDLDIDTYEEEIAS